MVVKRKLCGFLKSVFEALCCSPEVNVTVISSPCLKSLVGVNTTVAVPPPENVPAIIPVFFPLMRMLFALTLALLAATLKFSVMPASKATLLATAAGILLSRTRPSTT